jgi:uridine phosphorylase
MVSHYFDNTEFRQHNREFVTHTGRLNGKRITVMSTGIGPDNMDIIMNELDALANINLETRQANSEHKSLSIIRLGTSGALHGDIEVESLVLSTHGLGLDGSLHYYHQLDQVKNRHLTKSFVDKTNWPQGLPTPYIIDGSPELIKRLKDGMTEGITATAGGFYAPQGRRIRLKLAFPEMIERLQAYSEEGYRIVNFEMETASLYGLGQMLGHKTVSTCVILANRALGTYSKRYKQVMEKLIITVLDRIY